MEKYSLFAVFIFLFFIPLVVNSQGCWPDQTDAYWKIGDQYGSRKLSPCDYYAYYNCHGFVMSYFEDGCTQPSWMAPMIPAPYTCPNVKGVQSNSSYQSGVKYVKVCTESVGEIIYYDFAGMAGGHSAVKQIISGGAIKYLSKYGSDGPLVAHDRDGSVYHLKGAQDLNPDYWVYIGPLQGNTSIVGTNTVSFSVANKSEVNYSWSIVSGGSNVYINSASNQSTVSLKPTHSGTAVLRFTVGSGCATSKSKDYTLNIQTNVCLEGSYSNNGNSNINLNTVNSVAVGGVSASVTCQTATSFTWQKTSGNINGWFPPSSSVSFTMTSGGSISFLVTAKNGSTTLATRNVTFYNYGSFMVYPILPQESLKLI